MEKGQQQVSRLSDAVCSMPYVPKQWHEEEDPFSTGRFTYTSTLLGLIMLLLLRMNEWSYKTVSLALDEKLLRLCNSNAYQVTDNKFNCVILINRKGK